MRRIGLLALAPCSLALFLYQRNINQLLGEDLVSQDIANFKQDCQQLDENINLNGQFQSTFVNLDNQCSLLFKKIQINFLRFIYFEKYRSKCRAIKNTLINPIISHYQFQGIFDQSKLILTLIADNNFNNILMKKIYLTRALNQSIFSCNSTEVGQLRDLQQKLKTDRILDLEYDQKQRIDMIYNYLSAQSEFLAANKGDQSNRDDAASEIRPEDYLSKVMYL